MTPGSVQRSLTLAEGVRIRKTRRFPLTGEISVKPGDIVKPDSLLGHHSAEERLHVIKIEASDGKISGMLVRQPGDTVKMGEAIALSTYAFGMGLTEYCSPIDGQIVTIDSISGTVVVREHPEPLRALIPGVVAEVMGDEAVVIETCGAYMEGVFGSGVPGGGRLAVLATSGSAVINPSDIGYKYAGCVGVIGAECRHDHLMAALRGRMVGIIAGGGDLDAIRTFTAFVQGLSREEYEARFGGQRDTRTAWEDDGYSPGLSIVLTEGFGRLPIREQLFLALRKREGRYTFVDIPGAYSEHAEPPQVIIPEGDPTTNAPPYERNTRQPLVPGARVRLIGSTRFGQLATIESFPETPFIMPTGEITPAITVRVDTGETATVPRRNVEPLAFQ